jgi:hypothetical protein
LIVGIVGVYTLVNHGPVYALAMLILIWLADQIFGTVIGTVIGYTLVAILVVINFLFELPVMLLNLGKPMWNLMDRAFVKENPYKIERDA